MLRSPGNFSVRPSYAKKTTVESVVGKSIGKRERKNFI